MTEQEKLNVEAINKIVQEVAECLSFEKGLTKEEKEKREKTRAKTLTEVDFDYL